MNMPANPRGTVRTAVLVAYGLLTTGLALIMVSVLGATQWHWPEWIVAFVRDIGLLLAAVIAGTIIHEKLLRNEMIAEIGSELDNKIVERIPSIGLELNENLVKNIPNIGIEIDARISDRLPDIGKQVEQGMLASIRRIDELPDQTAESVHSLFSERPPGMTGIRLLDNVRRNFSGYYSWVIEQRPQDLFFAGRSVLHRIDADIFTRTEGTAEDIIFRRLKEGSKIKILFLDPRIDIIDRLAKEENQTAEEMLSDIATSIGISKRLHELIQSDTSSLQPSAELTIRVYDRVPYFAYHKNDHEAIVGFYFQSTKGSTSAAYEIVDDETKQVFGEHFERILSDAFRETLVSYDGGRGRVYFDDMLYHDLRKSLVDKLGENTTDELLNLHRSLLIRSKP